MKKYILIFFVALGMGILFNSCEKNDEEPVYNKAQTVSPVLLSPTNGDVMVWTLADSMSTMTFKWSSAHYKTESGAKLVAPNYILTASVDGTKIEIVSTSDTTTSMSVPDLNNKLLSAGLTTNSEAGVVWMVTSELPGVVTNVFSDAVNTKVTTYGIPEPPEVASLYVPGAYQGWDPSTAPQIFDEDGDGVYEGYVYFVGDAPIEFKFTSEPTWEGTNYGLGSSEFNLDTDPGAGDLAIPDAGGYYITCNTNDLVWSYELQNYGVIGSGILNGDWTEDVDVVPAEGGPYNILQVTIDVTESQDDGELRFKFRANDAWDINYGADAGSDVLLPGGNDIPMPDGAGNYTFKMLWDSPTPKYELIKN